MEITFKRKEKGDKIYITTYVDGKQSSKIKGSIETKIVEDLFDLGIDALLEMESAFRKEIEFEMKKKKQ